MSRVAVGTMAVVVALAGGACGGGTSGVDAPGNGGDAPGDDGGPPTYAAEGRGVFAHVVAGGGLSLRYPEQWEFWATGTELAGTQLSYYWSTLEPQKGQYDWQLVRDHIEPWRAHGKKVWIEINSVELPAWVESEITTVQSPTMGLTYPVFWEDAYKTRWLAFIDAFAAEFDGDPSIEFISTGGYARSHEPRAYGDEVDDPGFLAAIENAGYDGLDADGVWYTAAFAPIVSHYATVFTHTRIAQTITVADPFWPAMLDLTGSQLHYLFVSNGFSYKSTDAAIRAEWRQRSLDYTTDVGYSEWGPAGDGGMTLQQLYEDSIGSGDDISRISYLPLAMEQLYAGNTAAIDAVSYAAANLRDWNP